MSNATSDLADAHSSTSKQFVVAFVEVALIFVLFFVLAGGAAPDVNEAHYLGKAKHYWNPQWCQGDLLFESADAHLVFYWSFGWLTCFFSLNAVAWIGRCLTWWLLAWSWRRLSEAVVPGRLVSLLTAALFAMLLRCTHLAGEWVIGGVEAKGFAFVGVFLGLEALVRGRWRSVWILFGIASAFHVLVGGWAVVAAMIAWSMSDKQEKPTIKSMLPALFLGGFISLAGLLPGILLTSGADSSIVTQANEIYVHKRLAHHLLFHRILAQPIILDFKYLGLVPVVLPYSHLYFARHLLAIVLGVGLWKFVRSDGGAKQLYSFVAAALMIAGVGILLDQVTMYNEPLSAKLMRYYWFRLSDIMVPIAVALLAAQSIRKLQQTTPVRAQWALVFCMLLVTANASDLFFRRMHNSLPPSVAQSKSADQSDEEAARCFHDWIATCDWIANNTSTDEVFLTPRHQQTFKWFAQRGEVVAWKDIPQDAAGIVEWQNRIDEVFPPRVGRYDLTLHGEAELRRLAEKFGFRYVVIDRSRSRRRLAFPRVYPERWQGDSCYEVYLVTRGDE